ncbi:MAG: hypothetical protein LAC69_01670 [Chlorobium sp.]|jgi:hypothetical protein|nr:hypothetical protein [Chlorobium sp.]
MTTLLNKAFKTAANLPAVEQNALAKWLLDELHSEAKWQRTFAESEDILEKLADEAMEEKRKGKTTPLDYSRPPFQAHPLNTPNLFSSD